MRHYGVHEGCPDGVPEDPEKCIVEVVDGNARVQCRQTRIFALDYLRKTRYWARHEHFKIRREDMCGVHLAALNRGSTVWIPVDEVKP